MMTVRRDRPLTRPTLVLILLLAVALLGSGCARSARAQSPRAGGVELVRHTLSVDGVERSYLLRVPRSYKQGTATPLVVVLHGLGGSGQIIARQSGFAEVAEQQGFIVAFPDGAPLPGQRNLPGWRLEPGLGNPDTVYLNGLLDALQAEFSIDRIFIAGHSNGGFMAYRLACDLAGRIDAIGVVAGGSIGSCEPARHVPVMHIHGTADTTVPYMGGRGIFGLPMPPVSASIDRWRTLNGCEGEAEVSEDTSFRQPVTTSHWSVCQDGSSVTLVAVNGGGHEWPGGLSDRARGSDQPSFAATPALWAFFMAQ